jgi:hypothetical protein
MSLTDELFALVPADDIDHVTSVLRHRLDPDDIEVRAPEPGRYPVRDDRLHDDAKGARLGAVAGAAGGAVVGLGGAALIGPTEPVIWVLLAFGTAALGGLAGGVVGLQRHDPGDDDPALEAPVEDPGEVRLVAVHTEHHLLWAHRVLEHTPGVRFLRSDMPV